jgi:hypothetical protein
MLERALARASRERHAASEPVTPLTSLDPRKPGRPFPKQWVAVCNTARFAVNWSGRRASKTGTSILRTAKLNTERPGRRVLYIHQTALNAQLQFFDPLLALLIRLGVQHTADHGDNLCYWGNGSFLRAMGCDNVGEVKTKLGDRWDEIIVDEMQDYADEVLHLLIDKAAIPTLIDNNGSLLCQGTPPVTKAGFWYDLITQSKFKKFNWNLFDNPYIGHEALEAYAARGIGPGHPIYRREVLGEIFVDPDALVFKYESPRNDIPPGAAARDHWIFRDTDGIEWPETVRPDPNHSAWRYSMGLDLGFRDHDAIVVLGWRMDDPRRRLWECWTWQTNHLDYLKLADVFRAAVDHWHPQKICVDTGGHGAKKIMESLKAVFGMYTFVLKPASVLDSISLVNDELRTGRMLFAPNGLLAHDANLVVWKNGKHGVEVSETFHSDVMAALRYAHSCAYHYQAEAPTPEETDEDRHVRQWLERKAVRDDPHNPYRGGNSCYG